MIELYSIGYFDIQKNKNVYELKLYNDRDNANIDLDNLINKVLREHIDIESSKVIYKQLLGISEHVIFMNNNKNVTIIRSDDIIDVYLNETVPGYIYNSENSKFLYKFYLNSHQYNTPIINVKSSSSILTLASSNSHDQLDESMIDNKIDEIRAVQTVQHRADVFQPVYMTELKSVLSKRRIEGSR